MLEDMNTFAGFLDVSERENGLQQLRILQFAVRQA